METELDEVTYERCHFTCVYCGFDGRGFDEWMQLSIDHVVPRSCGGTDEPQNRVAACGSCNCITSRMKFDATMPRAEILEKKREYIRESRKNYYRVWAEKVAPKFLERPLLPLPTNR